MDENPSLNPSRDGDHDSALAFAAENHVRRALNERWRFVSSPALDPYLDRLSRRIASAVPGAPAGSGVALFDDDGLRSLPLPSGTILLSVGHVDFVDDEAELAFVLARELGHVARGAVAARLLQAGLRAVAATGDRPLDEAWAETAIDLARVGFGAEDEAAADREGLEAVRALGYDVAAIHRYLERLERRGRPDLAPGESEPRIARAGERRRALRSLSSGRGATPPNPRVNREVLRRAVGGRTVRRSSLEPMPLPVRAPRGGARPAFREPSEAWPWISFLAAIVLGWLLIAVLL